jgi:hypothetical protein
MPKNALGTLVITAGCWLAAAAHTTATVLLPADFTTVVTESEVIVHGRVTGVTSMLAGPRRTIESLVTLEVIDGLKGVSTRALTFRVPNGQVGRYRRILVGAPEFTEGDEVFVFLEGRAPAVPTLFGLSQGVYRVARAGGRTVVAAPVMARGAVAERVVRGDPARAPIDVELFAREVRSVLGRAR